MSILMTLFETPESLGEVFVYIAAGALAIATIGLIARLVRGRRPAVSGEEYLDLLYRQHTPFGQDFKPRQPGRNKRRSRSARKKPPPPPDQAPEKTAEPSVPAAGDKALVTFDTWRRSVAGGDDTLATELEETWLQNPMTVPVASLISLACGDTEQIKAAAAGVLTKIDPDASVPMLIAALETASAEEGDIIGSIMETIGDPRAAEPLLKFTRRQAGELFAAPAAGAPSSDNLEQARNRIRSGLKETAYDWLNDNFDTLDRDDPLTVAFIEALGELGDERAADMLLPLWRESEGSFKETVFDALIRVAGPELSDELLLEINPQPAPETADDADEGQLNGLDRLTAMLDSEDEFQRLEAVTSMDGNAEPEVLPLLARAARDESWTVRYAAVEALSHFLPDSEEARNALEAALSDSSRKVRQLSQKILKET